MSININSMIAFIILFYSALSSALMPLGGSPHRVNNNRENLMEMENAIINNDTDKVKSLLQQHGLSGCMGQENDDTPLHIAARENRLDILRILIEEPTDEDLINLFGHGFIPENPQKPKYLFGAREDNKRLYDEEMITNRRYWLINIAGYAKGTPLMIAVLHNHMDIIKFLCEEKNAYINIRADNGLHSSALSFAIQCLTLQTGENYIQKKCEVIRYLHSKGAKMHSNNKLSVITGIHYNEIMELITELKIF